MKTQISNFSSSNCTLDINDRSNTRLKYFLTFLAIGQSGVGFLALKEVYIFSIAVLLLLSISREGSFDYLRALPWVAANTFLYVLQTITFEAYDVEVTQLAFYMARLIVPAMYLAFIGKEFYKYFVKVIYYYSLISFFFWGIEVSFPQLANILRSWAIFFSRATGSYVVEYKNISLFLLYTFTTSSDYHFVERNAGPFWEPGAFAVYLVVALMMVYLSNRSVRNKYTIVLLIALVTTQSTAGYLSMILFLAWAIIDSRSRYKAAYLLVMTLVAYLVFFFAPFMNEKVTFMYDTQANRDLSGNESGRFHSARRSVNAYGQHPIIGRGISRRTAYEETSEYYGSYGIIDIPARYGLIMGIVYFVILYKSLKKYAWIYSMSNGRLLAIAAYIILAPVYISQGVYLSVINLIILQSSILYKRLLQ